MTVTDNSVSLKEYMTDPDKIYYYQVKAVPVTAEQKKYLKEGEFITSKEQDVDDSEEEEKEKKTCSNFPEQQYWSRHSRFSKGRQLCYAGWDSGSQYLEAGGRYMVLL